MHKRELLEQTVRRQSRSAESLQSGKSSGLSNQAMLSQLGAAQAMPEAVRSRMEDSLKADFSDVRIFESPIVGDHGAQAVASGRNVAFAPGKLDYGSAAGLELLGHELSHVASQARGEVSGHGLVNDAALERRADADGARAASAYDAISGQILTPMSTGGLTASPAGPIQAKKEEDLPVLPEGMQVDFAQNATGALRPKNPYRVVDGSKLRARQYVAHRQELLAPEQAAVARAQKAEKWEARREVFQVAGAKIKNNFAQTGKRLKNFNNRQKSARARRRGNAAVNRAEAALKKSSLLALTMELNEGNTAKTDKLRARLDAQGLKAQASIEKALAMQERLGQLGQKDQKISGLEALLRRKPEMRPEVQEPVEAADQAAEEAVLQQPVRMGGTDYLNAQSPSDLADTLLKHEIYKRDLAQLGKQQKDSGINVMGAHEKIPNLDLGVEQIYDNKIRELADMQGSDPVLKQVLTQLEDRKLQYETLVSEGSQEGFTNGLKAGQNTSALLASNRLLERLTGDRHILAPTKQERTHTAGKIRAADSARAQLLKDNKDQDEFMHTRILGIHRDYHVVDDQDSLEEDMVKSSGMSEEEKQAIRDGFRERLDNVQSWRPDWMQGEQEMELPGGVNDQIWTLNPEENENAKWAFSRLAKNPEWLKAFEKYL